MLKVNDIPIDFTSPSKEAQPYVDRINEAIDALKAKTGNKIRLIYSLNHSQEVQVEDRMGSSPAIPKKEYAVSVRLPGTYTTYFNGSSEIWTWYKTMKRIGQEEIYEPKRWVFEGHQAFDLESRSFDRGLLYYVVFVLPQCEKIAGLEDYQNPERKHVSYVVDMPEIEAKDFIETAKRRSIVENKIYNELSVEQLRTLAKAYDVHGANDMKEHQLMKILISKITSDVKLIDRFMEDININPGTEMKAVVNEAVEKNIIYKYNAFGKLSWKYNGKIDGLKQNQGDRIMDIAPGADDKQQLAEYFRTHPTELEILKEKIK